MTGAQAFPRALAEAIGPDGPLCCPVTGEALFQAGEAIMAEGGAPHYPVSDDGIAQFSEQVEHVDAQRQQAHYDKVAAQYVTNLGYPHTIAYMGYLDEKLRGAVGTDSFGRMAEICCGHGDAFTLFSGQYDKGIGVDISLNMLRAAVQKYGGHSAALFVQGDALRLPLMDGVVDTVVMLGGIHHVNDRAALFAEVARVLKPGGRFVFREPLDDFWLWRAVRAVVYRLSPALDHLTERPLRRVETVPKLRDAGLTLDTWQSAGFLGFCLFMNSDILFFNRLFRFVPGIKTITRCFAWLDDWILSLPGARNMGLQVIGAARKPG